MGAGAFCAVAQGSPARDAAIVRISYKGKAGKARPVAFVGKGICFDTGGHNLKPAKYMQGMHEDMNGSAVVLGILAHSQRKVLEATGVADHQAATDLARLLLEARTARPAVVVDDVLEAEPPAVV